MAENGGNFSLGHHSIKGKNPSVLSKKEIVMLEAEVDKDARLRLVKEKQNEDRAKKLEEIKAQAIAAQRFKEQKEQERRMRLEEMRVKEDIKRQQVEERKRAMDDAERNRLESILRRNIQRDARIESRKRNDRSSLVFAFGSSTPRNLDPHDVSTSLFWGHRRATSTQNIATCGAALTRRQSERDLDASNKKRATSAGGLERSGESTTPTTPAGCVSGYVGRRRTDLMPTIPSRDSSRKSLSHSPGRAYSMTRLDQLAKPRKHPVVLPSVVETRLRPMSLPSHVTRSMSHLAVSKSPTGGARRALNKNDSCSMLSLDGPSPRPTRATVLRQQKLLATTCNDVASSRPSSSLSQQSTTSIASSVNSVRHRPTAPRRQRPISIAITGISQDQKLDSNNSKPPLPKTRKSVTKAPSIEKIRSKGSSGEVTPKTLVSPTERKMNGLKKPPDTAPEPKEPKPQAPEPKEPKPQAPEPKELKPQAPEPKPQVPESKPQAPEPKPQVQESKPQPVISVTESQVVPPTLNNVAHVAEESAPLKEEPLIVLDAPEPIKQDNHVEQTEVFNLIDVTEAPKDETINLDESQMSASMLENSEMTASFIKTRITTEEEAKAALAERRRLAREEAERKAEQERLRLEEEARLELERQQKEEEQQRVLIEAQREAEQRRLDDAIAEAQKREEEERQRKDEEQRQKVIKEEAERKAKEEAEKQHQERLKNEEKEREARRKRVEAIMLRTRGKGNANSNQQQNSDDSNENKAENKVNGTKSVDQENGTKNGKDDIIVDNIMSDETLKNANTVTIDTINSSDSLNSNNSWQTTQQYGGDKLT